MGRLEKIVKNMTSLKNYPVDTPVGIIESATTTKERVSIGSLESIVEVSTSTS